MSEYQQLKNRFAMYKAGRLTTAQAIALRHDLALYYTRLKAERERAEGKNHVMQPYDFKGEVAN